MSSPSDDSTTIDPPPSTILVIEPDILVRMVFAEYLRGCGYTVAEGVTAADALTVLEAGRPIDIILAEVQLTGGIDGFALAQRIRESHPEIDVLLTSGVAKVADKAGDLCEEGPLEKSSSRGSPTHTHPSGTAAVTSDVVNTDGSTNGVISWERNMPSPVSFIAFPRRWFMGSYAHPSVFSERPQRRVVLVV